MRCQRDSKMHSRANHTEDEFLCARWMIVTFDQVLVSCHIVGGLLLYPPCWQSEDGGGDTKVAHRSLCSSFLPPADHVNNFPRVRRPAIDLPFLHRAASSILWIGKSGSKPGSMRKAEGVEGVAVLDWWSHLYLMVAIEPSSWYIGWGGRKGFTKSPWTWHYPRQQQITSHYIECDKEHGMYRTRAKPMCQVTWIFLLVNINIRPRFVVGGLYPLTPLITAIWCR